MFHDDHDVPPCQDDLPMETSIIQIRPVSKTGPKIQGISPATARLSWTTRLKNGGASAGQSGESGERRRRGP